MAAADANFRVYVRCRAFPANESSSGYELVGPTDIVRTGVSPPKRYQFDGVFHPSTPQQIVFETCALPLIDEFINGRNATIFAYGQTGTGKTYTMAGDIACRGDRNGERAGIIPRVLETVFSKLNTSDWVLEMKYIEIYNEELRDLFDSAPKNLRIYENRKLRTIEVAGATTLTVSSVDSALSAIKLAVQRRKTATTQLNSESSRSHAILTLVLVTKEPVSGMAVRSKLHLVDLAGSENIGRSGAVRLRAQEAGQINKSLLSLGRVIELLVQQQQQQQLSSNKQGRKPLSARSNFAGSGGVISNVTTSSIIGSNVADSNVAGANSTNSANPNASGSTASGSNACGQIYVPYRESKLTYLLQDSLGGSTKTSMIATINLASTDQDESRSTLNYALRARSIKNETQTEVELTDMNSTLQSLGKRLEETQLELLAQRSRDGVVNVSKFAYEQMKTSQRKCMELVAQREAAAQHHAVQVNELERSKLAVLQENSALKTQIEELKQKNKQYLDSAHLHDQIRISTSEAQSMFNNYVSSVKSFTDELSNTVAKLPTELQLFSQKVEMGLDANASKPLAALQTEYSKITDKAFNAGKKTCAYDTILECVRREMKALAEEMRLKVTEGLHEMSSGLESAVQLCEKLEHQLHGMHADLVVQKRIESKKVDWLRTLHAQELMHMEQAEKMSKKRRHIISQILEAQQQNSLEKLSNITFNAAGLASEMQNIVVEQSSHRKESSGERQAYEADKIEQLIPQSHLLSETLHGIFCNTMDSVQSSTNTEVNTMLNAFDVERLVPGKRVFTDISNQLKHAAQLYESQSQKLTLSSQKLDASGKSLMSNLEQQMNSIITSPMKESQSPKLRSPRQPRTNGSPQHRSPPLRLANTNFPSPNKPKLDVNEMPRLRFPVSASKRTRITLDPDLQIPSVHWKRARSSH